MTTAADIAKAKRILLRGERKMRKWSRAVDKMIARGIDPWAGVR